MRTNLLVFGNVILSSLVFQGTIWSMLSTNFVNSSHHLVLIWHECWSSCVCLCVCVCSWMFVCVCVTCTDLCSWLWQGNRGLGVLLISRWPHHGCRAVSPTINLPAWSLQMAPDSPALSPVSPAPRLPPNKKLPHYSSLGSALFGRHVEEWSFTIILFMKPRQRRPGLHLIGVIKRSPPND